MIFSKLFDRYKQDNVSMLTAFSVLLYVSLYLFFYPPIYAIQDEAAYFGMAYLYKLGKIAVEPLNTPLTAILHIHNRWVSEYPPGQSFWLILFSFLGERALYLSGMIAHLIGFIYFRKLLNIHSLSKDWALIYLFYPASLIYSRTLMGDIPSSVLILIGAYYYFNTNSNKYWAGFLMGLSLLWRPTHALVGVSFALCSLWKLPDQNKRGSILSFILGLSSAYCLPLCWNLTLYGNPLLFGKSSHFSGLKLFSVSYLFQNLGQYLGSLLIFFPGMLLAPFVAKKTRHPAAVLSICAVLGTYLVYYFYDRFEHTAANLMLGTRFLFPVLPFVFLNYVELLEKLRSIAPNLLSRTLGILALVLIAFFTGCLFYKHQQYLVKQESMRNTIYQTSQSGDTLIFDDASAELLQEKWGKRRYIAYSKWLGLSDKARSEMMAFQNVLFIARDKRYDNRDQFSSETMLSECLSFGLRLRETASKNGLRVFSK